MPSGKTHLKTWIDSTTRERFAAAACVQEISESALLKRLIEQMLLVAGASPVSTDDDLVDVRDARVTLRLKAEDRLILRARASARGMPVATYVSVLVHGHLRRLTPLPAAERQEFRRMLNELAAIGRNFNQLARVAQRNGTPDIPRLEEMMTCLQVCDALRVHSKALLQANTESWKVGVNL